MKPKATPNINPKPSGTNPKNTATYDITVGPYLSTRALISLEMVSKLTNPKYTATRVINPRMMPTFSSFLIKKPMIKPTRKGAARTTMVGKPPIVPPNAPHRSLTILIILKKRFRTIGYISFYISVNEEVEDFPKEPLFSTDKVPTLLPEKV